ncbi:hypothetical protein C8J56DRAFT_715669, partial [Mycena floridula]
MAEQFRDYHESIQKDGINQDNTESREDDITAVLEEISIRLPNDSRSELEEYITEDDITSVLDKVPNGKAPGIDGIAYEFWRILKLEFECDPEAKGAFDVVKLLQLLYNDIQEHGMAEGTDFA